jgi:hypothetical protein
MAMSPAMREHLARYGVPHALFRASLNDNPYIEYRDLGINKAPYYPFAQRDNFADPKAHREEIVNYLSAMASASANLRARGRYNPIPLNAGRSRHPIILDRRELARQGAVFNGSAILENPAELASATVDEVNPFGVTGYITGAEMGRPAFGRQTWQ